MSFKRAILTHGGAGSNSKDNDGPRTAANIGMKLMGDYHSALRAVVEAVKNLEDDPRFNAGVGSQLRSDGKAIQLDAACMTSEEQFGAVACIEDIQNPIVIAQEILLHSPHILLTGEGVHRFVKERGLVTRNLASSKSSSSKPSDCDTVGAVAYDGKIFSAALSSGGIENAAIGRVGDVPLPGCGLFCGPIGAVACTGYGEFIALKILARQVYGWLENKMSPEEAAEKAVHLFDPSIDVGLIILTKDSFAANSRNDMAWSHLAEES